MENKDHMSLGKPKNKFLLLASTLFVLLIVLLVLVIVNNRPATVKPNQMTDTTGTATGSQANKRPPVVATAPPMVTVASWVGVKAPASLPTSASVYAFKTAYTFEEAQAFAQQLNIQGNIQKNNDVVMAYSLPSSTDSNASLLAYKMSNGTFLYNSSQGIALPAGASTEEKVTNLLKRLGIYDSTLTSYTTYKDKSQEGVLFVEAHRDWKKVGLPILSPVGLLNIPESESLSSLSLASKSTKLPMNSEIYATSDRTDGYVRKDDFNTITLGINETTQKVILIKSGIRPFATAAPNTVSLLTFDQAVNKLQQGQYEFVLTSPTGEGGQMPWENIYPMNKAEAETATVTDSVIVYLEQPTSANQTELMPYYVFRANAMLKSGYRATIIAGVPAVAQTNAFMMPLIGVNAQTPQGQQQGTFELSNSPTTPSNPNQGTTGFPPGTAVTPGPDMAADSVCRPSLAELGPIYNIGGANYGWAPYALWEGEYRDHEDGYWYYIPTETDEVLLANIENIVRTIETGIPAVQGNQVVDTPLPTAGVTVIETDTNDQGQKQGTFYVPTVAVTDIPARQVDIGEVEIRVLKKVMRDIRKIAEYCPVRVTGSSPSVFIYGETGANLQVRTDASVTYSDPVASDANVWNVAIAENGALNVNGLTREFIYYEYDNASFNRPSAGWNVKRSGLKAFAGNAAARLGLTASEADRLSFELEHAASKVSADRLFVGLISKEEVDAKLPLSVSSGYTVNRVYFFVGEAKGAVTAPSVDSIVRSPSMVVELGSYGAK